VAGRHSLEETRLRRDAQSNLKNAGFGVPYGSRTRVAAVKEKRPIVIQGDFAAWIALYRTSRTHGHAYWTFNGRALGCRHRL